MKDFFIFLGVYAMAFALLSIPAVIICYVACGCSLTVCR